MIVQNVDDQHLELTTLVTATRQLTDERVRPGAHNIRMPTVTRMLVSFQMTQSRTPATTAATQRQTHNYRVLIATPLILLYDLTCVTFQHVQVATAYKASLFRNVE
jgi:hypothetical protein